MDEEYLPDEADDDLPDRPGWRGQVRWLAGGVLVLVALGIGAVTYLVVNPSPAVYRPALSPYGSPAPQPRDPLDVLRQATRAALAHAAPDATVGTSDHPLAGTDHPGPIYVVYGQVNARGRHGGIRVRISGTATTTCTGRVISCRAFTSPGGLPVVVQTYDLLMLSGEHGQETAVIVEEADGWWVEVDVDNADEAPVTDLPVQFTPTGQAPPLTEDEVVALATDTGLDLCADLPAACATGSPSPS
jgi:hypothetical protein